MFRIFGLIYRPAQIARACGRVSVGVDPDKRPVKRRRKTGSRRRTGEPRLHGGSRLKATTDRAFLVSVGPSKGRQPKRLVFLAGRADRDLPFQTMATLTATIVFGRCRGTSNRPARFGEYVSITAHHPIVFVGPSGLPQTVQAAGRPPFRVSIARAGHRSQPRSNRYWRGRPRPS